MLFRSPASLCASRCAHQVSLSFRCWDALFRGRLASCAQSGEALGIRGSRFGPCRDRISEATEKEIGRGQRGAWRLVVHAFMPLSHFTDSDSEGSRLRNTGKRFNEMNSPNYAHLATRAVCGGPALPKLAPGGVQEARRDEVRQTRNLRAGADSDAGGCHRHAGVQSCQCGAELQGHWRLGH